MDFIRVTFLLQDKEARGEETAPLQLATGQYCAADDAQQRISLAHLSVTDRQFAQSRSIAFREFGKLAPELLAHFITLIAYSTIK